MSEKVILLNYKNILEKLKNQESHLLLGNGFNLGLGVNTSYESIFQKMIENDRGIYKDVKDIIVSYKHDVEKFIGKMLEDINDDNLFLKKYVGNKVKYDFMKAAHEIIKSEIKNVYAKKNQGIFLLLKNFTNYFTLNYDSLLYLLLLNFKSNSIEEEKIIAVQSSLKFVEEDMNEIQNDIYSEIKNTRSKGMLNINTGSDFNSISRPMGELTKKHFTEAIKEYSKSNSKRWKTSDIERVVNSLLEEEKSNNVLTKVDDGSVPQRLFGDTTEFVFDIEKETQNLFFLHGAFHIYKDGKTEKKITQQTDKALYDRLEEILNNEEQDIICVFQAKNKMEEINKSEYLKKSYDKLSKLSGAMVIIGCKFSENDGHIFDQINKSQINTLYISTRRESCEKNYIRTRKLFPDKNIILFEAESITYELPVGEKDV